MAAETGHWITVDGRHVFIDDAAGSVPRRLQPAAGEAKRFSKAHLERHLIEHHQQVEGKGTYTAADERALNDAAGAGDPFTFHNKLPTEIKDFMAGRPEMRSIFKVSSDAGKAGGADAFSELGDRYLDIAEAKAGSPLRAAKATAHGSNDPEVKLLAAVHDNLPEGRFSSQTISTKGLRVGDEFTIGGSKFRVAEDDQGLRVLEGGKDYPETPVDALDQLPIDKGSFKHGRRQKLEAAPFSRVATDNSAILLYSQLGAFQPAMTLGQGLPAEKNGQPCSYFWKQVLRPGTFRDAKGNQQDYPPGRIDKIIHSFSRQKVKGLLPFLPPSHTDRGGDKNLGFVIDARKAADGSLEFLHQIIGEDAKRAIARNGSSICLFKSVRTQDGEVIEDFIDHNAIVPDPQIPDLKDFEPALAASRWGEVRADVYQFASERSEAMPITAEQKQRLSKLVPNGAQLPDEPTPDYFLGLLETTHQAATAKAAEATTALSRAETAETQVTALSRQVPKTTDPEVLHERSLRIRGAIDGVAKERNWPKAFADGAKKILVGADQTPNVIMLSRGEGQGDCLAMELVDLLRTFEVPPPTGETAHLYSRPIPGSEGATKEKTMQQAADEIVGAVASRYRVHEPAAAK